MTFVNKSYKEEFEDTKGVIRISKNRQHNGQKRRTDNTMVNRKSTEGQTTSTTYLSCPTNSDIYAVNIFYIIQG